MEATSEICLFSLALRFHNQERLSMHILALVGPLLSNGSFLGGQVFVLWLRES
jgi:hypothetical protein